MNGYKSGRAWKENRLLKNISGHHLQQNSQNCVTIVASKFCTPQSPRLSLHFNRKATETLKKKPLLSLFHKEQKHIQDMLQGACFQLQIWKSVYPVSCAADQLSSHRKIGETSICPGKSNITCFPKWGWWNPCADWSGQCCKWEQFQSLAFHMWLFSTRGFTAQGLWHLNW